MKDTMIKRKITWGVAILSIIFSLLILINCSSPHQINDWKGKVVYFPDSLEKFNNIVYPSPDYKLLVIFNGGCSLCIASLTEWSHIMKDDLSEFNIAPVFIGVNSDKEVLKYNLDKMKFKYNVLIETDSVFYKANSHLELSDNDFYLLTYDNKVLLKGNTKPEVALRKYLIEPSSIHK
jgi:hypothetical protein